MYKIIGADGREYGPATADQIRQWINEGRANTQTLTQIIGSAEWKPLSAFPELLQRSAAPTAPAAPTVSPARVLEPATNSSAISGLVFGILSITPFGWFCCIPIFAILGIVFSSRAISQINRNPLTQTGKSMATIGMVLSILGLFAPLVFAALLGASHLVGRRPYYWRWHRAW